MKPADRTRLTVALRGHVAAIAGDLRARMGSPGPEREKARQVHAAERVGEDFDVWTDLLSRRAAVLWVLKSVYVRVLEDRGLLSPGRLLDAEAQHLFEILAPNLGETAFLRWIYLDLASRQGGLPELFSPLPAEVALPSDAHSKALIDFWRHVDPDTGARWSFKEERFEGELMGDLYQELDPVVKDRFALCQTPDFVRAFILDRTLTPAIETFGADTVRLLDPACGSGHFLIDGLKRLVESTAQQYPDWERPRLVAHCLDRVVGMDLNDYACALARARLIMTASEIAGVDTLADAARFHPHVYWADALEQVERDGVERAQQLDLFEETPEEPPARACLTRPEVRVALRKVLAPKFHAVVANPPYITEKDPARKAYHREKNGAGQQRYVSAYREYSLASPFTERCVQLAVEDGHIGLITSNNFMKREFGKVLIETVLPSINLTLVVDTSQAFIPHHGTPTVLLFARNVRPADGLVRAVMGKRGETIRPEDPIKGRVWTSIVAGWSEAGFESEFVSVADVPWATFSRHPWSLGGGGAADLRLVLERHASVRLGDIAEVGTGAVTRENEVYLVGGRPAARMHIAPAQMRILVEGDSIRDWNLLNLTMAIWPYEPLSMKAVSGDDAYCVSRALWPWRTRLAQRVAYGKSQLEHGLQWFEYSMFFVDRFRTPLSIAFAEIASHNQFVLDRGGKVFAQTAPVIKLRQFVTEDDYLALLGLLNSSTLEFWMKQVCHVKGGESTGTQRQSEAWSRRIARDGSKMKMAPLVTVQRSRVVELARRLDKLGQEQVAIQPSALLEAEWTATSIRQTGTSVEN